MVKDEIIRGKNSEQNCFVQRNVGRKKLLIQKNRLGEWHGYVWKRNFFAWKRYFENKKQAEAWIKDEIT